MRRGLAGREPWVPPCVVGVPRFELGTSPTRTERATRLRHTPRPEQGTRAADTIALDGAARRDPRLRGRAARPRHRSPTTGRRACRSTARTEVTKVVCAVSSSLELFERAAEAGAQLVVVHHGLLWDNEPRVIDARVRRRLAGAVRRATSRSPPTTSRSTPIRRSATTRCSRASSASRSTGRSPGSASAAGCPHRADERSSPASASGSRPSRSSSREGPDEVERVAIVSGGGGRAPRRGGRGRATTSS